MSLTTSFTARGTSEEGRGLQSIHIALFEAKSSYPNTNPKDCFTFFSMLIDVAFLSLEHTYKLPMY